MPKKQRVVLFVSYARANKELARKFLTKLKEQVLPSRRYKYEFWQDDTNILVGEDWDEIIKRALDKCHIGLLLISPAFLGSQYITEEELPRFVGDEAKPVLPIMLQPVDFERHDLKGLKRAQIFRLDGQRFTAPKAFGECVGNQRDRFVQQFFLDVERRLDQIF